MIHSQPQPQMQRSRGTARVVLTGAGRLADLAQSGSAKAIVLANPAGPEVVFLNTSGGITGGDRLSQTLVVGAGARATGTTQTAERAYRSASGLGRVDIALELGAGAHLDWLPLETILFQDSALHRRTRIELGAGASVLALESVVLGRAAMGETVTGTHLDDRREFRRNGRPVHLEALRLDEAALMSGAAGLNGARALASLVLVSDGAEAAVEPARAALTGIDGVAGAVSGYDGRLVVRLLAADGWPLRKQIVRLLAVLRQGPLPRVWQI